jgi:hypothetical protein
MRATKNRADASLKTVEPLEMVRKHPTAATLGGLFTAILCGLMGTLASGGLAGVIMAAIGAIVGAPGAAHVAESAEPERPV